MEVTDVADVLEVESGWEWNWERERALGRCRYTRFTASGETLLTIMSDCQWIHNGTEVIHTPTDFTWFICCWYVCIIFSRDTSQLLYKFATLSRLYYFNNQLTNYSKLTLKVLFITSITWYTYIIGHRVEMIYQHQLLRHQLLDSKLQIPKLPQI